MAKNLYFFVFLVVDNMYCMCNQHEIKIVYLNIDDVNTQNPLWESHTALVFSSKIYPWIQLFWQFLKKLKRFIILMVSTDILKRSTINTVRYTCSIDKIYTKFIELQGNQHFQFSLPIINLILLIPQSFTLTLLYSKRRNLKVFF